MTTLGSRRTAAESQPLGAVVARDGVHFSVYSANAQRVELLLFDAADDARAARVLPLGSETHAADGIWRIFVPGIAAGQLYGWRVHGEFAPEKGWRFDGEKVLLDPYTRAVAGAKSYDRLAAAQPGNNCARALKSVVVDPLGYDWSGDAPPRHPWCETVIYELHVGGFTRHPSAGVDPERRGTFAGLAEKIPYLESLGITAVELMPIHEFDVHDAPNGRRNYWGYSPLAFFAPHSGYSSRRDPLGVVDEFRDLVRALHRAGLEVILDVVFNHTAEVDETGPTVSLRGLENAVYYLPGLEPGTYANHSGCGNTVNANHPVVRQLILDCLHAWVTDMHVDGFRFDLAPVLTRGEDGKPLAKPPLLEAIANDPVLSRVKLIAEPWEAGGLYQAGVFAAYGFAEWNDRYRDDVRRFVRGDPGRVSALGTRLTGSRDLFGEHDAERSPSVNFVTCHDGFTLADLVSYDKKHNEANGEDNRDGANENFSWNCGVEGPSEDSPIEELRRRQIRNLLTILFFSRGVPMLLMGDEVRRSQRGNNNAYCQDNELSWLDWSALATGQDLLRFTRGLIRFARTSAVRANGRPWDTEEGRATDGGRGEVSTASGSGDEPRIHWHGVQVGEPDWSEQSRSLAFSLESPQQGVFLHVILNAYAEPLTFELPPPPDAVAWKRIVDTALPPPDDFQEEREAAPVTAAAYRAGPRSCIVLMTRAERSTPVS